MRVPTLLLGDPSRPRLGIDVAAPSELAWGQLIELDWWPRWGPTVRSARLDDGSRVLSAGATGQVQPVLGPWLPFEVTDWYDDGVARSWAWRVAGVQATEHSVLDLGDGGCRVEMSVPWWAASYLGVVGLALVRIQHLAEDAARD